MFDYLLGSVKMSYNHNSVMVICDEYIGQKPTKKFAFSEIYWWKSDKLSNIFCNGGCRRIIVGCSVAQPYLKLFPLFVVANKVVMNTTMWASSHTKQNNISWEI